ncbi:MAG TPA: hypothetical protein VMU17_03730, partial [Elusimicrobiota bacterium]|nr:hypothetical protein [Elusimicrobiota bacterium]
MGGALLVALALSVLPSLLQLNQYRPDVTEVLEKSFHCHVSVGNVSGEIFPRPGFVVGHVVFTRESRTPQVLASV